MSETKKKKKGLVSSRVYIVYTGDKVYGNLLLLLYIKIMKKIEKYKKCKA